MASIAHNNPWLRECEPDPFDPLVAASQLSEQCTPLDVVAGHLKDDGAFTTGCVSWMRERGYDPSDIGSFAKSVEVPQGLFVSSLKPLAKTERREALNGYMAQRPTAPMPSKVPDFEGWNRRVIYATEGSSSLKAKAAWAVFTEANRPEQMFSFGGRISWVKADRQSSVSLEQLSNDGFLFLHHVLIEWRDKDLFGPEWEREPETPVLKNMQANPHCPLPPLLGVRPAPVFGPGGVLADGWGYDAATKLFIWPRGLSIPFVPRVPTNADVAKARNLIEHELLGDFPFDDEASKTNAIAALLHPFVRPMISGATPLHLIDKPTPGTGGSLLAEAITFPALGESPPFMSAGKLEDEWRFRLFAELRGGPAVIVLDNITEQLKSETLASMLTAPDTVKDRIIRSSETVAVPVRNLWIATGNNMRLSNEMARRSVLSRMDANMERPEEGREFLHPRLMEWAREHRSELVWAALVMVQAWVAAGCPRGSKRKGSFDSWAETMSGIFEVVGIKGFMDNNDKLRQLSDVEGEAWKMFVEAWLETHGTSAVGAGELLDLAEEHLGQVVNLGSYGQSRSTKWGTTLRAKRGAVIAGHKITPDGTKQRAAQWRLVPVNQEGAKGEPDGIGSLDE